MSLKQVEQIRGRILRTQQQALMGVRAFISMTDGNQDAMDELTGEKGTQLLADVTDMILDRLGHKVKVKSNSPYSKTRRAAKKAAKTKAA